MFTMISAGSHRVGSAFGQIRVPDHPNKPIKLHMRATGRETTLLTDDAAAGVVATGVGGRERCLFAQTLVCVMLCNAASAPNLLCFDWTMGE